MGTQNTACTRILAGGLAALAIVLSKPSHAQAKKQQSQAQQAPTAVTGVKVAPAPGDKVDITDLESKYWAPKDTDFSVVQNRTYSKDHKFAIAPVWGRPINDSHSEGNLFGATANYFWSERMGVQVTYLSADLKNNQGTDDLKILGSGVQPDHGKISAYYGVGYNLVPFYAKMSFWGKRIIYFDMAFTPHIGMTEYDQIIQAGNKSGSALTYGLDISQFFFFSRWLAVRVDLKNHFRTEEVRRFRSGTGYSAGDKVSDKNMHDTMFLVGTMFYF
jgi:outer membrane beta-barrel protein